MSNRDEYVRKMQAKLEEWNADIDTLSNKASGVTAELKHEYEEQIALLKVKQATARAKVAELQQAGEGAWEDMKSGLELAKSAMSEALASVRARFK